MMGAVYGIMFIQIVCNIYDCVYFCLQFSQIQNESFILLAAAWVLIQQYSRLKTRTNFSFE